MTQLNISWAQIFQYEPELLRRNTPGDCMLFQNGCDLSQPFSISVIFFLLLFFLLLANYGGMAALGVWTNLLWVLLACARGWAALSL